MSKKAKVTYYEFQVPMYRVVVRIYPTKEELAKDCQPGVEAVEDGNWGACVDVLTDDESGLPTVVMTFLNEDYHRLSIAAHESVHAAWAVLGLAGVKSNIKNQEPLAYLTEHIFEQVEKALAEYSKNKKKGKK